MVARLRGPSGIGASAQAAPATTPLASCHPDPGKESVTGGASCMVEDHQPRLLRVGQLPGQPMTVPAMGEGASSCAPLTSRNPGAAAGRGALLPADAAATHSASGIRPWLPRLARQCSIRPRNSLNSFVPSNVRPMHPPASHSTGPRTVRTVFSSDHARLPEGHGALAPHAQPSSSMARPSHRVRDANGLDVTVAFTEAPSSCEALPLQQASPRRPASGGR
jgi:hypothetical protein